MTITALTLPLALAAILATGSLCRPRRRAMLRVPAQRGRRHPQTARRS